MPIGIKNYLRHPPRVSQLTLGSLVAIVGLCSCRLLPHFAGDDATSIADEHAAGVYTSWSAETCATLFPKGTWINLLTANRLQDFFVEIAEAASPSGGWEYRPGSLRAKAGGPYSHLLTGCSFGNFEMEFAWTIPVGANSGVKYGVDPSIGPVGLEYQILDDQTHPDALVGENRQAGALYDLYAPKSGKKLNPPGTMNTSRIVFRDGNGEHWLNGERILQFQIGTADFVQRVKQSKFKNIPRFGTSKTGSILLQHHGNEITFNALKIRSIDE